MKIRTDRHSEILRAVGCNEAELLLLHRSDYFPITAHQPLFFPQFNLKLNLNAELGDTV